MPNEDAVIDQHLAHKVKISIPEKDKKEVRTYMNV